MIKLVIRLFNIKRNYNFYNYIKNFEIKKKVLKNFEEKKSREN